MSLDNDWVTEICKEGGSAFSFKLGKKLHEEQSPFQRIEIYQTESYGNLMLIDGFVMLSDRDNFLYHEMMTHPAMFTHPQPKNVVIIGGGDCGTLREVLKHPGVHSVIQVDIDERVTRLSEQYFPRLCESNDDPRATLLFDDGIQWMKQAEAGSVDIIIVDSTDPIGPAEGLFNETFYRSCYQALGSEGILVQQSESPIYHMQLLKAMRGAMHNAGFTAVHTLPFPQPVYPSGWWTCTMVGKGDNLCNFRNQDAAVKDFDTEYYNADIHRAALAQPEFMRRAFAGV